MAQMETTAGDKRGNRVRRCEGANVIGVCLLEVIRARGVEFDGKARGAGVRELFGVKADPEAAGASGGEQFAGLRHGEGTAVAENITKFGERFTRDLRDELVRKKIDVGGGAIVFFAEFGRDDVGAQECGDNFERLLFGKGAMEGKSLEFALRVKAVAAFAFESGGAVFGESAKIGEGARFEKIGMSGAKFSHRREDSTAGFGNLLVGGPGDAAFMFVGAAIRKDEVSVRIDEAGEDYAIAEVEFFGFSCEGVAFDFFARAHGYDASALNDECAIADDGGIGKRFSATRRGSSERQEFRAASDE
jgi:hypothetical protein